MTTTFPDMTTTDHADQRPKLQFGLRGLLLVTALVAVWGTHLMNQRAIERMEARIAVLRGLAPELSVDDPSRISVVKLPPQWYDENRWDLFLPSDRYRLCLATQEVDEEGFAPVDDSITLPQGRMQLELVQTETADGWTIKILAGERELLAVHQPADWNPAAGASTDSHFDRQKEADPDQPVVLFRRRFMVRSGSQSKTPPGPTAGVLMWIEPVEPPASTEP